MPVNDTLIPHLLGSGLLSNADLITVHFERAKPPETRKAHVSDACPWADWSKGSEQLTRRVMMTRIQQYSWCSCAGCAKYYTAASELDPGDQQDLEYLASPATNSRNEPALLAGQRDWFRHLEDTDRIAHPGVRAHVGQVRATRASEAATLPDTPAFRREAAMLVASAYNRVRARHDSDLADRVASDPTLGHAMVRWLGGDHSAAAAAVVWQAACAHQVWGYTPGKQSATEVFGLATAWDHRVPDVTRIPAVIAADGNGFRFMPWTDEPLEMRHIVAAAAICNPVRRDFVDVVEALAHADQ